MTDHQTLGLVWEVSGLKIKNGTLEKQKIYERKSFQLG